MAFRWRADHGSTMNAGFVALWLFRGPGFWPVLLRNPICLWFFRGVLTPCPLWIRAWILAWNLVKWLCQAPIDLDLQYVCFEDKCGINRAIVKVIWIHCCRKIRCKWHQNFTTVVYHLYTIRETVLPIYSTKIDWEHSGSVLECMTRDRRVAGSSFTGVTALWSMSKTHLS